MAVDSSGRVLARQKLKEAEQDLWQAVDLAELGTFVIDPAANRIEMSPRFKNWLGYKPEPSPPPASRGRVPPCTYLPIDE
ncbi:hypothetical protein [Spirosoma fluminis]